MKQVLQNVRTGRMEVADVPCPEVRPGCLLIQTRASLISAGTERMLVEFSQAGLIQKARQKPDQVRLVLDMMKTDGVLPTLEAVFRKLDEPLPLGYCNAGVVQEVGAGVRNFQVGDRVASNGPHAELVCVPANLCARIPHGVSDEQAAFTVLGSIALQGIRLAYPSFGEKFVVYGLGLVGLLAVQLLRANGCEVLGIDLDERRLDLAKGVGARIVRAAREDVVRAADTWSGGRGADGVLICAAAKTDDIVHHAAQVCRKRGRVVLIGVVGLNLRRSDFYEKEITFQVSCSYGPGRYDEEYEQRGHDYPYGLVRWTEQRNFEAVLQALQSGSVQTAPLTTHRFPLQDALVAYEKVQRASDALGIMLQYPAVADRAPVVRVSEPTGRPAGEAVAGIVGAGSFAGRVLMPAIAKTGIRIAAIASLGGVSAQHLARKYRAEKAVTDYRQVLDDPGVNTVFVAVQHHLHARLVCEALKAGKHVFCEKPLCITQEELDTIMSVYDATRDTPCAPLLMVGFNRRFSAHTVRIKELLKGRTEPLCMTMTVNAGAISPDHWTQDPERGGGRIIGEACHFIDLLSFIAESPVSRVFAMMIGDGPPVREDKISILLGFADGSIGTVHYFANGARQYPKEALEIFSEGRVIRMENFRVTRGWGFNGRVRLRTPCQDKGHEREIQTFVLAVASGEVSPTAMDEIGNVTQTTLDVTKSIRSKSPIAVAGPSALPG